MFKLLKNATYKLLNEYYSIFKNIEEYFYIIKFNMNFNIIVQIQSMFLNLSVINIALNKLNICSKKINTSFF